MCDGYLRLILTLACAMHIQDAQASRHRRCSGRPHWHKLVREYGRTTQSCLNSLHHGHLQTPLISLAFSITRIPYGEEGASLVSVSMPAADMSLHRPSRDTLIVADLPKKGDAEAAAQSQTNKEMPHGPGRHREAHPIVSSSKQQC